MLFRRFTFLLLCASVFSQAFALHAQNATNTFWQSQSIYQIITDRFFNGDTSNDNADGNYNPANSGSVHGGDFKGAMQKLDYIKSLGATAIWISPIVLNGHGQFYGYAARDFYHVDPHWGSLADLQNFVQAAHARGLLVIDDIVVNHGDDLIYSTDSGYGNFLAPPSGYTLKYHSNSLTYAPPFDTFNSTYNSANNALTNYWHNYGDIQDFNNTNQLVLGELSGLDDFRTETPFIRSNMAAIYESWIGQVGFDGFRIDTTEEVDMGFWQTWCPAVHAYAATNGLPNFFMFGEVDNGSDAKCGSYTGNQGGGAFKEDSVLDYPLYFTINSVFATATGNTKQIEDHYNSIAANYDPSTQMRLVTFLDNHDQPRFLSNSGATTNRLEVALTFLYTSRGIPCLYYGTEQGFDGTTDPNNREDMFAGQFKDGPANVDSFNMTSPLFLYVAQMNNFRRLYPALQLGSHVNQWNDPDSPGLFAYARRWTNSLGTPQEVFVVFNTATTSQTLTNRSTTFPAGSQIVNLLNTNEVLTIQSGPKTPLITVAGTTAKIFVAQSALKPLDPVVMGNAPAHDTKNVPINFPVVLQFSEPMDTNSVQSAFAVSPSVAGTFAWNAAQDTVTFTPGAANFAKLTTVVISVTNSAVDAVSGNHLYAAYQLQFHTANAVADVTPPTLSIITPATNATITRNLAVSGTSSDNASVQKVEVALDSGPWLTAVGTSPWSLTLTSSNFLNGPHLVSARATDASGNISATNTVNVRFFNVPGNYLQRIIAGNPASVADCTGNTWRADTNYTFGSFGYIGGTNGNVANPITGICTQAQPLYQRERFSTNSNGVLYQFDCPEGVYAITLLEAETFWSGPGEREFNIFIQGSQVFTNFDIFAAAGGMNLPVTLVFTNSVTNSQLQVLVTPVVDHARISGLQVQKIADVFSDTDGIPDWWRLAYFGHALGQAGDLSRGSDDADGDGVSNLTEYLSGTDPLNPTSFPTLAAFNIGPVTITGGNLQLGCNTVTNWTYQLQYRDTLDSSLAWINIGPPVPGTGNSIQLSDPDSAINATRFYRVQAR